MELHICDLTAAERCELLEALRRDMRQQDKLAKCKSESAGWHAYNVRTIKRIIECINPKTVLPKPQELAPLASMKKLSNEVVDHELIQQN